MRLYNCVVNVGGANATTVPKVGVTAAEILVLRAMFGADNVMDIRKGPMRRGQSHADEHRILLDRYASAKVPMTEAPDSPTVPVVPMLFGSVPGARLPVELDGDFPFIDEKVETEDRDAAAKADRKAAA